VVIHVMGRDIKFRRVEDGVILEETRVVFVCEGCGKIEEFRATVNKKFLTQRDAELFAINNLPSKLPNGWGFKNLKLLCDECMNK